MRSNTRNECDYAVLGYTIALRKSALFTRRSQSISHTISILCVRPLNDGGLIKKITNNTMLITPKKHDGFAIFFQLLFLLKMNPHAIIAIPKLMKANSQQSRERVLSLLFFLQVHLF